MAKVTNLPSTALQTYALLEPALRWNHRDWGKLAIVAATQARLCPEDVASLRTNLENEWAIQEEPPRSPRMDRILPHTRRHRRHR